MDKINEAALDVCYKRLDANMQSMVSKELYAETMVWINDFIPAITARVKKEIRRYDMDKIGKIIEETIESHLENQTTPARKFIANLFSNDHVKYAFRTKIETLINAFFHDIITGKNLPEKEINKCIKESVEEVLQIARSQRVLTGYISLYRKTCEALKRRGLQRRGGKGAGEILGGEKSAVFKPGSPTAGEKIKAASAKAGERGENIILKLGRKLWKGLKRLIRK